MDNFKIKFESILDKEFYTTPPLMDVVVAKLNGTSKDIPRAFKLTKEIIDGDMKHLRRIKNQPNNIIECVICKYKASSDHELKSIEQMFASDKIFSDFRITKVPASAPRTDLQLKACSNIWPCKFAKSSYLNQCIDGSVLKESEKFVLETIIKELLYRLRNGSETAESGAVIFRRAEVHGLGLSSSKTVFKNPTMHSVMLAIDSVATNAGAGHWKEKPDPLLDGLREKLNRSPELRDDQIDANFLPYLCTNYDIFVTEEPCFMCTMAMVQSRIRRLFYLDCSSMKQQDLGQICYPDGAIETFYVHRAKNLNHRFEAWRVSLSPELNKEAG